MKIFLLTSLLFLLALADSACQSPSKLLLKGYRPQSIYKIPINKPTKSLYLAIDMHSHPYAKTKKEIASWIEVMKQSNNKKTVILVTSSGDAFDSINKLYAPYSEASSFGAGLI